MVKGTQLVAMEVARYVKGSNEMSISDDIELRMEIMQRAERIMDYADEQADWATACQIAKQELGPHAGPMKPQPGSTPPQ